MRARVLVGAAVVPAAILLAPGAVLAGITSATNGQRLAGAKPTSSVAYKLAVVEKGPSLAKSDPLVKSLQKQLDALGLKCMDRPVSLAESSAAVQKLLRARGIRESLLSIITHVNQAIPKGLGKQRCADDFGAYMTKRMAAG